jgi:3-hydroxyisobutyrate dehydrogenase-like beta-hydroxyacid dehydrogenase
MDSKTTVGVVGLGIMGYAFAMNARKEGFPVVAWNRGEGRAEGLAAEGITIVGSPAEVVDRADVVIVMVSDVEAVRAVLEGPGGLLEGEVRGKTILQMSTIDADATRRFAVATASAGAFFVDAPVAGSKPLAEAGEVIVLAGGDEELIERWKPVLLAIGKEVVHAGPIGMGTALKLCMNLIVAQMTTALCEAVTLAKAQALDPTRIFDVLRVSPALDCGYFRAKERPLLTRDFAPQFSLRNMLKDARFIEAAAAGAGVALPITSAVRVVMEEASHRGFGDDDLSGILRIIDRPKPSPG